MKQNSYIPQIALDNIINKKRRSILSVVSISLSVAIVFVSLTLFTTILDYSRIGSSTKGSFHYFLGGEEVAYDSYNYHIDKDVVYGYYGNYQNHFFSLHGLESDGLYFIDYEGNLPLKNDEIMVPLLYDVEIGDTIELHYQAATLATGNAYLEEKIEVTSSKESKIYTVVGKYKSNEAFASLSEDVDILYTTLQEGYQRSYFYIYDNAIQNDTSLGTISALFAVQDKDIFTNVNQIASDLIIIYLQDTKTLLAMFLFVIVIAIFMSIVSIYNVLIVSDRDRRKEIGLLKSIGATANELKIMVVIELFILGLIGSVIGVILGIGIAFIVLKSVFATFHKIITVYSLLNPFIISISSFVGILLMIISGYFVYRKYFYSNAIADLKGDVVHYDVPYNPNRFTVTTVTWRLFIIYNERIKKQTRNLRRSFFFIMLTITLFSGIALSNFVFIYNYKEIKDDFFLEQKIMKAMDKKPYFELSDGFYEMYDEDPTLYKTFVFEREFLGLTGVMPLDILRGSHSTSNNPTTNYVKKINKTLVLDARQIDELFSLGQVVYGRIDSLSPNGVILIDKEEENDYNILDRDEIIEVLLGHLNADVASYIPFKVDAIIKIDEDKTMFNAYDQGMVVGFREENYENAFQIDQNNDILLKSGWKAKIYDSSHNPLIESTTNSLLSSYHMHNDFTLINYLRIKEEGSIATFMIEVLLYPLLLMLVIIGAININNVLKGNMHMKRSDFSIMKSVGITTAQLKGIMIFEYIENFVNAGLETFLLCFPIAVLERYINIASVFKISDNYVGMMVISFCIISPIVISLLAINSFRELNKITAIENMNDSK